MKRVFLGGGFARTADSDAPQYHQRNVVAFPQSPDAALTALGCTPDALAETLLLQYKGSDRELIRTQKELTVSVPKLRAAFLWLSQHNWIFLWETRDHPAWAPDCLAGSDGPQ